MESAIPSLKLPKFLCFPASVSLGFGFGCCFLGGSFGISSGLGGLLCWNSFNASLGCLMGASTVFGVQCRLWVLWIFVGFLGFFL